VKRTAVKTNCCELTNGSGRRFSCWVTLIATIVCTNCKEYKNNYLTDVVFQLKFTPILTIDSEGVGCFQEQIRDLFPQIKEGQEFEIETKMSPKKAVSTKMTSSRPRWTFFSEDKSKAIVVTAKEFALEYRKYQHGHETKEDFNLLWEKFQAIYNVQKLDRVGLRYINQITLPSGNPLDWHNYINDKIISATLDIPSLDEHDLARSMHRIHWVKTDHRITFQFGIHNSDFPGPIAKKEFILDYDCFSVGPTDASNASKFLMIYNEMIGNLFEKSIGEKLRELMGVVEDSRSDIKGGLDEGK